MANFTHSLGSGNTAVIVKDPMLPKKGCLCGFFGKEVIVLGVWFLIGSAVVTIGIIGITGKIPMAFMLGKYAVTSSMSGGAITGVGGLIFIGMLYEICFFCQRRTNRSKTQPLGGKI